MNNSHQPYAESVYAVHQRYEDTSLIIFNQLQKSLGKVAKLRSAGAPSSGPRLPVSASQPPRMKSDSGRGEEAGNTGASGQEPRGGNPSSPGVENQNPPQSKIPAYPKQTSV